ncbi:alpha/beta hydrolase [Ahrensia sp. R2A130]|uniref:alpha/beta hydrolase n=1 Tax=Ahrensia sp. R2A130 TaxID=744979 RepID=UPI0001E0D0CB|nr:phospholipase/carboxylesterase [Ahrensia sp. R2A130]EFL90876.1 phospholipase/carboxylesterase [Ahrensia sp. R2A130]
MALRAIVLSAAMLLTAPAAAQLAPFKNDLFNYPAPVTQDGAGDITVAYNRERDMVARDKVLRRKAHDRFVDTSVRWKRRVRSYASPNGTKKKFEVGAYNGGAAVTVIYVHGKGGNRRQGVNDWTFGGNFNRLQNLMARNRGLLITPDFAGFGPKGTSDIEALATHARVLSPAGKLYIACGSMGGSICWRLASDPAKAALLDGIILLGARWNDSFLDSATIKSNTRDLPIVVAHGTADVVFPHSGWRSFLGKLRARRSNYPVRMVSFENGVHGTPIRMIDWRDELNRLIAKR